MKFCSNCGNEITEGFKFCNKCGTKVPVEEPVISHATVEPKAEAPKKQVLINTMSKGLSEETVPENTAPKAEESADTQATTVIPPIEEPKEETVDPQATIVIPSAQVRNESLWARQQSQQEFVEVEPTFEQAQPTQQVYSNQQPPTPPVQPAPMPKKKSKAPLIVTLVVLGVLLLSVVTVTALELTGVINLFDNEETEQVDIKSEKKKDKKPEEIIDEPEEDEFEEYFGETDEIAEARNVLVIGVDDDQGYEFADVIMLFSISPENEAIACTSIPRDTRINYRGSYMKLTEIMAYGGVSAVIDEVEDVTYIEIDDYIVFNYDAAEDVIDALGGVEFNVPQNMKYEDPEQDLYINLRKGKQVLDGEDSVDLLRFRSYPMGDIERTKVQRDFMKALFTQKSKIKYLASASKVYAEVKGDIKTSIGISDVKEYAKTVAKMSDVQFVNIELPYSVDSNGFVVLDKYDVYDTLHDYFD